MSIGIMVIELRFFNNKKKKKRRSKKSQYAKYVLAIKQPCQKIFGVQPSLDTVESLKVNEIESKNCNS